MERIIFDIIQTMFGISVFLNASLFVPQAIQLLKSKNSNNLSLLTFLGFNFIQLFTILHGYITKDYTLMIGFALSFLTCGFVTILIFFYRKNYV